MGAMPDLHVPAADRDAMVRDFVGVVTAKVHNDDASVQQELGEIMRAQYAAADGDVGLFGARMAKQVEAAAVVTQTILRSLATRLDLTEAEAWQIVAEVNALRPPATD